MSECTFCRIVAGDLEAQVVMDEPDVVAFLDTRPLFAGHTLLVPRRHVPTVPDLPAEIAGAFWSAGQRLAAAIPEALGAQGTFMAVNNVVSQSVPHLHLHVVPRTKGDGLRGFFWPRTSYSGDEAGAAAASIRTALGG
ncbi:HIT family protein [Ruania alkalisoli]|uniref:HIT family protein n=1 Tax=Ruania alkalisoli TaxID=2779775 RepID=A0A7M1ST16_9MICO|nr:HIT family protein [Ruania alkalisoli]QOR70277.1 HIT family protein [Ruania alkalisoli]